MEFINKTLKRKERWALHPISDERGTPSWQKNYFTQRLKVKQLEEPILGEDGGRQRVYPCDGG